MRNHPPAELFPHENSIKWKIFYTSKKKKIFFFSLDVIRFHNFIINVKTNLICNSDNFLEKVNSAEFPGINRLTGIFEFVIFL